jgi:hypothetical protein
MSTFDQYQETLSEEDKLISFVTEQLKNLERYSEIDFDSLSFDKVNRILCKFYEVARSLQALQFFAQKDYNKEKNDFDFWLASESVKIRLRENKPDVAGTKWLGQKEIDMLVRVECKEVYKSKLDSLSLAEQRLSFITNMLKSWDSQQFALSTLSKNLQSEVSMNLKNYV